MSILIEHDKRKEEILEKAFDVFTEEGYANATFQKIADRCGITRTTLYLYFKNKREIFLWSMKQVTDEIEEKCVMLLNDTSLSTKETLYAIFDLMIDCLEEHKRFFNILLPYLMDLQKQGKKIKKNILRRTVKLRHFMTSVIIDGQKKGEVKKLPVREINDLILNLFEGAIFRIIIYEEHDVERLQKTLRTATSSFLI